MIFLYSIFFHLEVHLHEKLDRAENENINVAHKHHRYHRIEPNDGIRSFLNYLKSSLFLSFRHRSRSNSDAVASVTEQKSLLSSSSSSSSSDHEDKNDKQSSSKK